MRTGRQIWIAAFFLAAIVANAAGVSATGGNYTEDITTNGVAYRVHTFTDTYTPGSFDVQVGGNVEVLVVAGGGGAGQNGGGGGGAGGCIYRNAFAVVSGTSYTVTVGAGGEGATYPDGVFDRGDNGGNSVFATLTAVGGGGGASRDGGPVAGTGGSGGGGAGADGTNNHGTITPSPRVVAGTGTSGQGNVGGMGFASAASSAGGGGGGYASAGTAGASLQGGNGGNGFWTDISGAYTGYCGGGAGSGVYGGQGIPGTVQAGAGGGGPQNESRDGRPNSGGGGGGIVGDFFAGNGGDGIVIVRYSVALYTVTYNANGATSGTAPASQTKIAGTSLTLASNSGNLARPGYFFVGWNTAADGSGTLYAAGGSYTTDASVTLYAKWYALPTYTITYNANGATSGTVPASQTKTNGIPLTLASNSGNLARTGYTFAGWNTAAAGSGTSYAAGANYTVNVSVTLYAKWAVATRILAVANNNANQRPLLQWITAGGATYTVLKSTNLLTGWSPVFTGSAGTAGSTNVFTDTNAVERSAFYKIRIP